MWIKSKVGSSRAARLGDMIECRYCVVEIVRERRRGLIGELRRRSFRNDGRPLKVCDKHYEQARMKSGRHFPSIQEHKRRILIVNDLEMIRIKAKVNAKVKYRAG